MNFTLTPEKNDSRHGSDFTEKNIKPSLLQYDVEKRFPYAISRRWLNSD